MAQRVIGYGLATKGEARRYMYHSIKSLKRLCDKVIILCNNCSEEERDLLKSNSVFIAEDNREWGLYQNKIKQDFLRDVIQKHDPDICIACDMDEVFDPRLTKDAILEMMGRWHALYFFFVQHWNTPNLHNPSLNFWNVRAFRWNGDYAFENRPLHPGLCPKWTYKYGSYAPYVVHHYGLMKSADRLAKVQRYKKYDPQQKYLPGWYKNLESKFKGTPVGDIHNQVTQEVDSYKNQDKKIVAQPEQNYYYVRRLKDGKIIDIPKKNLDQTLKKGFELISTDPIKVVGNTIKRTEVEVKEVKEPVETKTGVECRVCGFVSKSETGLKIHQRTRHDGYSGSEVQEPTVREGDDTAGVGDSEFSVSS